MVLDLWCMEMVDKMDEYYFIYFEFDVYFLLVMIYVVIVEGKLELGYLVVYMDGLEDIKVLVVNYSFE